MSLLFEKESYEIRGSAFEVYKALGCGHKEVVYQKAFFGALLKKFPLVEREKQLPVYFQGKKVGTYTPDIVVENKIPIELKAKPQITSHDIDQFWHYLTGTEYKLGFLINFGKPGGVEIIRRVYDEARKPVPRLSAPDSASFRVAIAHDSFTQLGGAERIVEALHQMFPEAPVFTLVFDVKFREKYKSWDIRTSGLQTLYSALGRLQYLLPLTPWGVDSLNFDGFDVVISSSSGFVKNIRVPKNCIHINYCHTPTRFLWSEPDYVNQEVSWLIRPLVKLILTRLKKWDYNGAQRVTHFLANSKEVQARIKKYYNRDSTIIYPFIDTEFWYQVQSSPPAKEEYPAPAGGGGIKKDYFLLAGRLQAHKRNDLIIEIFNDLNIPLHVVGTGRQENYLRSIGQSNIKFLGRVSDEQLRDEYSGAKGFIYPQLEDFGLMPLEAAACGTATLAYGKGGALETIVPGVTGEFYGQDVVSPFMGSIRAQTADKSANYKDQIKPLILSWKPEKYNADNLRTQAEKFSKEKFKESILKLI